LKRLISYKTNKLMKVVLFINTYLVKVNLP